MYVYFLEYILLTTSVQIFPPKFVLGNVQRPNVRLFLPIFEGNLFSKKLLALKNCTSGLL